MQERSFDKGSSQNFTHRGQTKELSYGRGGGLDPIRCAIDSKKKKKKKIRIRAAVLAESNLSYISPIVDHTFV